MATLINIDDSFRGSVVLFAVDREAKAFLRLFPDAVAMSPTRWVCNRSIVVELLGVGKSAARAAVENLLASGARPQQIIVAGFAGALRTGLPVADMIIASEVVDEHGGRWNTHWPKQRSGRVLTCDQMIGEPARKIEFGKQHAADCVDMESSAVAKVCHAHGIPFGCVRVMSDDVSTPLSKRLMGLVESGRVPIRRVLWELVRSPKLVVELVRLAKHTRRAADALAPRLRDLLRAAQSDANPSASNSL